MIEYLSPICANGNPISFSFSTMKTHLPLQLRAALLAAIFACAVPAVQAAEYNTPTELTDFTISSDNVVSSELTLNGKTTYTHGKLIVNQEGWIAVNGAFSMTGGNVQNEGAISFMSENSAASISNAVLNNARSESYAQFLGGFRLVNSTVTNAGMIWTENALYAEKSTISNNGTLVVCGYADVVNSKITKSGEIAISLGSGSRSGKAVLTIDAATVANSGTNAVAGLKLTASLNPWQVKPMLGKSYYFAHVEGYGHLGIQTGFADLLQWEDSKKIGNTFYFGPGNAYHFDMNEIRTGSSLVGVTLGEEAALLVDNDKVYGNVTYTDGETVENLTVGSYGADSVTVAGGELVVVDTLAVTGKGSVTLTGGTLEAGAINGPVTIKLGADTATDTPLVTLNNGSDVSSIKAVVDMREAATLNGKKVDLLDGQVQELPWANVSASNGAAVETNADGTGVIKGENGFDLAFEYSGALESITFGAYGQKATTGGTVSREESSKELIVQESSVSQGDTIILEQSVVTGGSNQNTVVTTDAPDVLAGSDQVLSSHFNNPQGGEVVDVVYGSGVEVAPNRNAVGVSSLSTTLKTNAGATLAKGSSNLVVEFNGEVDMSNGTLGFAGEDNGKTVKVKEGGTEQTKQIASVDIIKVSNAADVNLKGMTVNADRALEMEGGKMTLTGTRMTVGGDHVELEVPTRDVVIVAADGSKQIVKVETGATAEQMLELHTVTHVKGGTLTLDGKGGKETSFAARHVKNQDEKNVGETHFHGSDIDLQDTDRGVSKNHKVCFGKADNDHQTIHMHNSTVRGTGRVENTHFHGGHLKVGNSPGVLTIKAAEFSSTTWTFHLMSDASLFNLSGANTDPSKAFSQLVLDGANNADGVVVTFNYELQTAADTWSPSLKDALDFQFKEGASITLIDTANGSISGSYSVNEDSLPELETGLIWDTSRLFTTGAIYVIYEMEAEPARVANTMVSAAATTGAFGRMALSHAADPRLKKANVWFGAYASCLDRSTSRNHTGFDSNTTGYAVGVDRKLGKMPFVVGAAFGQSNGTVKPNRGTKRYTAGKIDQDGTQLGVYGSYTSECPNCSSTLVVDAYLSYGQYENDSQRTSYSTGNKVLGSWDEDAWAMGITVTRNYEMRKNTFVSPFIGLEYTTSDMDGFNERGQGTATYNCVDQYRNLAATLGVGVHQVIGFANGQKLTPYANASISQDILRQDAKVVADGPGGTVIDKSAHQGRTAVQMNLGTDWQINKHWNAGAGYSVEFRADAVDQHVNVSTSYAF